MYGFVFEQEILANNLLLLELLFVLGELFFCPCPTLTIIFSVLYSLPL